MFRKKYKEFIDSTKPNRELIDIIYQKAEAEQKPSTPSKLYKFTMRYGAGLAAVLVLSVSAVIYTNLDNTEKKAVTADTKNNDEIVINSNQKEITEPEIAEFIQDASRGKESSSVNNTPVQAAETKDFAYTEKKRTAEVLPDAAEITEHQAAFSEITEVSENEIKLIDTVLKDALGEKDNETQNEFIFEIVGKFSIEDEQYYLGRWKWFVVDHSSMLCDFVLKGNLSEMYECRIENDNIVWKNENNLLER